MRSGNRNSACLKCPSNTPLRPGPRPPAVGGSCGRHIGFPCPSPLARRMGERQEFRSCHENTAQSPPKTCASVLEASSLFSERNHPAERDDSTGMREFNLADKGRWRDRCSSGPACQCSCPHHHKCHRYRCHTRRKGWNTRCGNP